MKKYIIFLFSLLFSDAFGQYLQAEYIFISDNKTNPALSTKRILVLKLNGTQSIGEMVESNLTHKLEPIETIEKQDAVIKKISDEHAVISPKKGILYFKDYLADSIFSTSFIMTKKVIVKEKLDQFQWKILEKDTTYFETKCKIAQTEHRGHTWTVFFTDRFGLNGGPWKLDGLPGLILHAKTEDDAYVFNALKVTTSTLKDINNPFVTEKTISWEQYTKSYKEKVLNQVKKMNAMNENGEKDSVLRIGNTIEDLGFKEIKQQ